MILKFFVLIVYFSTNAFSQSLVKKVYTDKTTYIYGETIFITIRAINTSSIQDTLIFPNTCEAYPYIDNTSYLDIFGLGCFSSLSERIIPAQDSIEWIYECPHPSNPGLLLSIGQHNVFGQFRLLYFNPDTFIISNTDTIEFLVNESSSAVINETNQYFYSLEQNYPNPFNPITKIKYSIQNSDKVQIKIYDIMGGEIETLLNEYKQTGNYEVEFDAGNLTSGVYFYIITSGNYSETKKMILLR